MTTTAQRGCAMFVGTATTAIGDVLKQLSLVHDGCAIPDTGSEGSLQFHRIGGVQCAALPCSTPKSADALLTAVCRSIRLAVVVWDVSEASFIGAVTEWITTLRRITAKPALPIVLVIYDSRIHIVKDKDIESFCKAHHVAGKAMMQTFSPFHREVRLDIMTENARQCAKGLMTDIQTSVPPLKRDNSETQIDPLTRSMIKLDATVSLASGTVVVRVMTVTQDDPQLVKRLCLLHPRAKLRLTYRKDGRDEQMPDVDSEVGTDIGVGTKNQSRLYIFKLTHRGFQLKALLQLNVDAAYDKLLWMECELRATIDGEFESILNNALFLALLPCQESSGQSKTERKRSTCSSCSKALVTTFPSVDAQGNDAPGKCQECWDRTPRKLSRALSDTLRTQLIELEQAAASGRHIPSFLEKHTPEPQHHVITSSERLLTSRSDLLALSFMPDAYFLSVSATPEGATLQVRKDFLKSDCTVSLRLTTEADSDLYSLAIGDGDRANAWYLTETTKLSKVVAQACPVVLLQSASSCFTVFHIHGGSDPSRPFKLKATKQDGVPIAAAWEKTWFSSSKVYFHQIDALGAIKKNSHLPLYPHRNGGLPLCARLIAHRYVVADSDASMLAVQASFKKPDAEDLDKLVGEDIKKLLTAARSGTERFHRANDLRRFLEESTSTVKGDIGSALLPMPSFGELFQSWDKLHADPTKEAPVTRFFYMGYPAIVFIGLSVRYFSCQAVEKNKLSAFSQWFYSLFKWEVGNRLTSLNEDYERRLTLLATLLKSEEFEVFRVPLSSTASDAASGGSLGGHQWSVHQAFLLFEERCTLFDQPLSEFRKHLIADGIIQGADDETVGDWFFMYRMIIKVARIHKTLTTVQCLSIYGLQDAGKSSLAEVICGYKVRTRGGQQHTTEPCAYMLPSRHQQGVQDAHVSRVLIDLPGVNDPSPERGNLQQLIVTVSSGILALLPMQDGIDHSTLKALHGLIRTVGEAIPLMVLQVYPNRRFTVLCSDILLLRKLVSKKMDMFMDDATGHVIVRIGEAPEYTFYEFIATTETAEAIRSYAPKYVNARTPPFALEKQSDDEDEEGNDVPNDDEDGAEHEDEEDEVIQCRKTFELGKRLNFYALTAPDDENYEVTRGVLCSTRVVWLDKDRAKVVSWLSKQINKHVLRLIVKCNLARVVCGNSLRTPIEQVSDDAWSRFTRALARIIGGAVRSNGKWLREHLEHHCFWSRATNSVVPGRISFDESGNPTFDLQKWLHEDVFVFKDLSMPLDPSLSTVTPADVQEEALSRLQDEAASFREELRNRPQFDVFARMSRHHFLMFVPEEKFLESFSASAPDIRIKVEELYTEAGLQKKVLTGTDLKKVLASRAGWLDRLNDEFLRLISSSFE